MNTVANDFGFWGMHFVWWFFWICLMVLVFGFNLTPVSRRNSNDPMTMLRRRFANGSVNETDYQRIKSQLEASDGIGYMNSNTPMAERDLARNHPFVDGLSLSASWIGLYTLCGLFYWVSPATMQMLSNRLFHGAAFVKTAVLDSSFGYVDFLSVLTIGAIFAFVVGVLWSVVHAALIAIQTPRKSEKMNLRLKPN